MGQPHTYITPVVHCILTGQIDYHYLMLVCILHLAEAALYPLKLVNISISLDICFNKLIIHYHSNSVKCEVLLMNVYLC